MGRGAQNYLKGGKGDDCANVPSDKTCITNGYLFDTQLYSQTDHFITGVTTNWNPTEAISNRFNVGWDYLALKGETTRPFGHLYTPDGYFWDENTRHTKLSLDYAGSFQNSFGESIASTFSWGGQVFQDKHRWTEWDVEKLRGPGPSDHRVGRRGDVPLGDEHRADRAPASSSRRCWATRTGCS